MRRLTTYYLHNTFVILWLALGGALEAYAADEPTLATLPALPDEDVDDDTPQAPLIRLTGGRADELVTLGPLGYGSFGGVELVQAPNGLLFARKMISKGYLVTLGKVDQAQNEQWAKRLVHPFLGRTYLTYQDEEFLYFLQEPYMGGELFRHLKAQHRLSEGEARFYAAAMVLALAEVHRKRVIFRDLKLENIVLDRHGFPILIDFGLLSSPDTYGLVSGTAEYLAPEVIRRQVLGPEVDWWALGILIYEMLHGHPPFQGQMSRIIFDNILFSKPNFYIPRVSKEARDLIGKLLVLDPRKRLGSAKLGSVEALKSHPWFKIEFPNEEAWEKLLRHEIKPIFVPVVNAKNRFGLNNFSADKQEKAPMYKYRPMIPNPFCRFGAFKNVKIKIGQSHLIK